MLGEDHSLLNEFPEYKERINQLNESDATFAEQANKYNELDAKIRNLELDNAPIGDDSMHQLKHERAQLKDILYRKLSTK